MNSSNVAVKQDAKGDVVALKMVCLALLFANAMAETVRTQFWRTFEKVTLMRIRLP